MTTEQAKTNPHKLPEPCKGIWPLDLPMQLPTRDILDGRRYRSQEDLDKLLAWLRQDGTRKATS